MLMHAEDRKLKELKNSDKHPSTFIINYNLNSYKSIKTAANGTAVSQNLFLEKIVYMMMRIFNKIII